MKETSGEGYQSTQFAKALCVSEAKVGKTSFLIAAALGQLPWQAKGGLVDKPENCHVVTFDANAAGGIKKFLVESCGAPAEALKFRVYNMQEDMQKIFLSQGGNDYSFFQAIKNVASTIADRCNRGGVPVVLVSSLTGAAKGLLRGLSGPAAAKRGGGMDQSKWSDFAQQIADLQQMFQLDLWHCLWEAHIFRPAATGQDGSQRPETLQVPGSSAQNFPYNVEQVLRIRRQFGTKHQATKVDKVFFDTQASMDFIANGRGFTECLNPQEPDPTFAFHKLGLKVGHWGGRAKKTAQ